MPIDVNLIDADLLGNLDLSVQLIKELGFYLKRGKCDEAQIRLLKLKEVCVSISSEIDTFLNDTNSEVEAIAPES